MCLGDYFLFLRQLCKGQKAVFGGFCVASQCPWSFRIAHPCAGSSCSMAAPILLQLPSLQLLPVWLFSLSRMPRFWPGCKPSFPGALAGADAVWQRWRRQRCVLSACEVSGKSARALGVWDLPVSGRERVADEYLWAFLGWRCSVSPQPGPAACFGARELHQLSITHWREKGSRRCCWKEEWCRR